MPEKEKAPSQKTVEVEKKKPIDITAGLPDIRHKGYEADDQIQKYVQYAYKISGKSLDFVATLEAENGAWDMYRQSDVVKDGIREDSYGFCQLHRNWHSEIVDDPKFWDDPYRQLDRCREKYKGGTKFYGYYNRNNVKNRFITK